MAKGALVSPPATARLVVTMPPEPSRLKQALERDIASHYLTLTTTTDAFLHLAARAVGRLTIMVPYIDRTGARWASDLFEATAAPERLLVLRDERQLLGCGSAGKKLRQLCTTLIDYSGGERDETFHAKVVLADGVAAYVGSANLLRRSKVANLECGMLIEGPAVSAIKTLVDAVVELGSGSRAAT